jgi:hypothetical protein
MSLGLGLTLSVRADMAKVRCDFYPKGEDKAILSTTCSFSQRQGNVGITKPNGARYDFRADPNQAGVYTDNNNNKVTRELMSGDIGLIFRTSQQSIYIYWDNNNKTQSSQGNSQQPQTSTTVNDFNTIAIKIQEGEFNFKGILKRTSSKKFTGTDGKVNVSLNPYNGHVVVINSVTGTEFYNYYISPVSGVGEDPDTMCDPSTEPC